MSDYLIEEKKFPPTVEGCDNAREYLNSIGAWSTTVEKMDGYSIVHHANLIYNQIKKSKK
jgi:hypothetical protein